MISMNRFPTADRLCAGVAAVTMLLAFILTGPSPAIAHSDASSFGGGAGMHDHPVDPIDLVARYPAQVIVDPRRVVNVTMRVNARIHELLSGPRGTRVSAGDPLARFTSAELRTLQASYIEIYRASDLIMGVSVTTESKLLEGRMNLQWRGLSEADIERIELLRQPVEEVTIYAPIDGYLTEVNIGADRIVDAGTRDGLFTAGGTSVFQIADPGALLIEVNLPGDIAAGLVPGDTLAVAMPGVETPEEAAATVDLVLPLEDPATPWARTVRLIPGQEIAHHLRPGQLVTLLFPEDLEHHHHHHDDHDHDHDHHHDHEHDHEH